MNKKLLVTFFVLSVLIYAEGKKSLSSRSSGAGRGSSKKTKSQPQPTPTSLSYPQPAQKPSLSGWQENPAQKSLSTWQTKTQSGQGHSYPSSQTGLSGSKSKPPTNQDSIQNSHVPQSQSAPVNPSQSNSQHGYPSSNTGLSASGASRPASPGAGYPQGSGLSGSGPTNGVGSGAGYPQTNGQNGYSYPSSNTGLSGSGVSRPGSPGAGYPQGSGPANAVGTGTGYPQGSGLPASGSAYPHGVGSQGSGYGAAPPPYTPNKPYNNGNPQQNYGSNYHHPAPPPPYPNYGSNYGGHGFSNPSPQMPGYFGNYGNSGKGFGVSRTSTALKGVGIAGVGVGTLLTGLALWNLARSTGRQHHTVIYDNRGQPVAVAPANDSAPQADSFLSDLVNCSLTISTDNSTEVLAIPCAIASSFSPDADVKDVAAGEGKPDTTKCIVSVMTKTGKEYMTTIPCATLLNTAAENNVTEPPIVETQMDITNGTVEITSQNNLSHVDQPSALSLSSGNPELNPAPLNLNCTLEPGEVRDPINPCFAVTSDLSVTPLQPIENPKSKEI